MAKSKANKTNRRLPVLLGIFVICLIVYLLIQSSQVRPGANYSFQSGVNYQKPTVPADRVLVSKYGHFSVVVPEGFSGEAQYTDAVIKNKDGEIRVDTIGTNYKNLNDYFEDLVKMNNLFIVSKENIRLGDKFTIKAIISHSDKSQETAYFIYPADWTISSISTNSEILYPVLDEVARSFRYVP